MSSELRVDKIIPTGGIPTGGGGGVIEVVYFTTQKKPALAGFFFHIPTIRF